MVIEKEKQNAEGKGGVKKKQNIFIVVMPLRRMFSFNEAKNIIYNRCGSNTLDLLKQLLISFGVDEDLLILTTNDKIGYSYKSNREFAEREILDILSNSYHKNVTESNKKAKAKRIKEILEKEMNDETIEIKVINATFHLIFLDFLSAFLEDRAEIIIKNDYNDNNKTKVYFYKSEQTPFQPYYRVNLKLIKIVLMKNILKD